MRFAPAIVVVIACSPRGVARPERSGGYTEFRDGACEVVPDCTPPPGAKYNPCNPPPPREVVACPAALLPTQPPDTEVTVAEDGTCWIECTAETCDAPGPLRVACPVDGTPPPTYETALVISAATSARYDTGVFHRAADFTCTLVECEDGTACTEPPGRTLDVPCPPELAPTVAPGVVPVRSSSRFQCFYGHVAVACPDADFHVWH